MGAIIKILQRGQTSGAEISFSGIGGTPRKVLGMANILPLLNEEENGGSA